MATPVRQQEVATGADIESILRRAAEYLPADRLGIVREAYEFAAECHDGQTRRTGDPYITHPLEVTVTVTKLELDQHALAAALLHDVQEDCGIANETIEAKFGADVARLVDGLTKLEKLPMHFGPEQPRDSMQAQNLRKMFLAMAEDIRVVLIKLCDRLHNMRTLWAFQNVEKQRRIARETMEIYAPLANRLGVWQIKWELEDLAFRYLEPERYRQIAELLASKREARERHVQEARDILQGHLASSGIEAEVTGRAKHIYSIYNKMVRYSTQEKSFDQIYDLLAIRVFVDSVSECYHALGVIHALWRPVPGQFDDYIANPKDSMYQSLHTTVVGPGGLPLEIQIRTHDMHRVAEYGIAAHWRYKEGGKSAGKDEDRIAWLRQLLDWQRDMAGAEEFVESVKTDIFQDQVFVYTPKGQVLDMPAGATSLDFAYRIHTDLGHQTVGAKVNGRMVSLNRPLKNGDVVEIIRSRTSKGPSRDWLNTNLGYVRTTHSKEKIRQWFRRQERNENIERGRQLLEKELRRLAVELSDRQETILQLFNYTQMDDFLAALGYGGISTNSIARKLGALIQEEESAAEPPPALPEKLAPAQLGGPGLRVLGVGNLLTTMARCCNPVPGDQIVGYVTRTRGVTVHRADCLNVLNEDERERLVEVEWGAAAKLYPVSVRIEAWDRVGLLRDITTVVTEDKVNMVGVRTLENNDGSVSILATLETTGIEQLSRLLSRMEIIRGVRSVERSTDRKRGKGDVLPMPKRSATN
ncbi:MAG: bifunctional (p)ppGpp synthetase/guanosine-3',5'-bis(diphosphate) 3'-pyrophosphohydrolase [Dehalococcoidia bacterium]|nr:bifunctional (p)ppGpp synthetase/guanosine-3',5'-bis(diphosphate) 3'-pyrophosphohydrolase [Dehalococcoidia bacterium]